MVFKMNGKRRRRITAAVIIAGALCICFLLVVYKGGTNIRCHTKPFSGQVKVACVGDSITYGTRIFNPFFNSYPSQLSRMLGWEYHVGNYGNSGKTLSDETKESYRDTQEYKDSLAYAPDIVVIMLGTNDTKTEYWNGPEAYKEQYREFLEAYMELESEPEIYLCTPACVYREKEPESASFKYGITDGKVLEECQAVRDLAEEMNLHLIDIHTATAGHEEWYDEDGLHPNRKGAAVIAKTVKEALEGDRQQ